MYMKKKIINGFLVMALLVASVGSFVSCKDYEEDNYSELISKNASLKELVEKYKTELDNAISELKTAQEACRTMCQNKHAELDATIATLETKEHAYAEYERLNNEIAALKTIDGQLAQRIANAEAEIALLKAKDVEHTTAINNLQTELTNVKVTAEAAKNLADANKLEIDALKTTVSNLQTAVTNLQTWTQTWQSTLESVAGIKAQAEANKALIDSLIAAHKNCHDNVATSDPNTAERIDSIVTALKDFATKQELEAVAAQAKQYYDDAVAYTNLQVGAVNDKLNTLNATVADLEKAYIAADKELQGQIDAIKADVESLKTRVAANEQAIANLTGALKKMVTGIIIQGTNNPLFGSFALPVNLQSNILAAYYGYASSQGVAFPTLKPRYYVDPDDVILTEQDFEMLGVSEKKLVESGAVILGDEGNAGKVYLTINPNTVDFTGVELPLVNSLDENSGVMLSGLEKSNHKLSFGYNTRANNGFYEAKASIDPAAIEDVKLKINFGELKEVAKDIVNGNGINVSNVAKTVANQLSAFEMDANGVKASWTDAYGEHSVYSQYAIAATAIKPLSMSFGKDFNFKKVPGVDKAERFIGRISDKVFNKINSAIPDFSGLNFVAPQIKKIEIPALNPDSFKITINIETTVEYELNMTVDVEDVVINDMDGTTHTMTVTVPEQKHHVRVEDWTYIYEADGVTKKDSIWTVREEDLIIPPYEIDIPATNFTVNGQVVEIKDVLVKKLLEIPVSFTHVEDIYPIINSLYSDIVGPIEDVNVMLEDLESFMDDVNNMLDELNKIKDITNTFDDLNDNIKNQVAKYLDKFNNKFCNLINSTNKALRPVMLIKTVDGFSKVSQAYNAPTRISGTEATLVATSYTAEVLAPSYKKLVGVTNVIKNGTSAKAGDADCKSVLDAVNAGDLATVVDGGQMKFYANFKKGYTYELVYTTVDFHGLVDAKKFYVVCE